MMKKVMKMVIMAMVVFGLSACGNTVTEGETEEKVITESTSEEAERASTWEITTEEITTEDVTSEEVEQQAEDNANTDTSDSENDGFSNKETMGHSDGSYYGTWKVTAYYIPGVSAMSSEDAEGYIGKTCEYSEDVFNGDGEVTDGPDYQEFECTAADFSASYKDAAFEDVGITTDSVKQVNVSNSYDFGCSFYVKDANTILISQDGAFFEAVRQ